MPNGTDHGILEQSSLKEKPRYQTVEIPLFIALMNQVIGESP